LGRHLLPVPEFALFEDQGGRLGLQTDARLTLVVERSVETGDVQLDLHDEVAPP